MIKFGDVMSMKVNIFLANKGDSQTYYLPVLFQIQIP